MGPKDNLKNDLKFTIFFFASVIIAEVSIQVDLKTGRNQMIDIQACRRYIQTYFLETTLIHIDSNFTTVQ